MTDTTEAAGVKRRDFLKILGASSATIGAIGCSSDRVEKLIPYLNHPDETVPGVSNYYATTCRECSAACGVVAEVRDGRPIKLEGNPDHPLNRGALCARGQAALQGVYNPDRYRSPRVRQGGVFVPTTWEKAIAMLSQKLGAMRSASAAGNALFINQHESGSFPAFLDAWLAGMGMPAHLSYDAIGDGAVVRANVAAYGASWPKLDFGAARLIVSFGADFLETWGASVPQQLDFADARAKLGGGPRFVYIGARRSLTGLNADQWIPCKPGSELAIAQALGGGDVSGAATASGVDATVLTALQKEFAAAKPNLVVASGNGPNASALLAAVAALNKSAGNVGATIKPAESITSFDGMSSDADLAAAVTRMASGAVPVAFIRGANPAFTLPKSLKFAEAFGKVAFKVSFSSYPDETTTMCDLVLPDHHALESWGDAQPMANVVSLQQPTCDPIFDTRATADVLIAAAKDNQAMAAQYPQADYGAWLRGRFPGGGAALTPALARGVTTGAVMTRATKAAQLAASPASTTPIESTQGDMYLVVYPSAVLGDGSGANKPWLQELPDPVSKIAWQTWIEIHPKKAKAMGLEPGDVLTIETSAGRVSGSAYFYLGIRPDTVAIVFGRGHTTYGRYAAGVGHNPADAMPATFDASGALAWTSTKCRVTKSADFDALVTVEGSARQHARGIARAMLAADLGKPAEQQSHDSAVKEGGEEKMPGDASHEFLPGLRSPLAADAQGAIASGDYEKENGMYAPGHWSNMAKRRWAMTIDLARCTGCSACVTACYAENNIPTVGAPYQSRNTPGATGKPGSNIIRGREMNWIRLERYFEGNPDETESADFEARFVPMLCQHCGNAPCEPVCPVYATYHSPDGLNVQVYNRCVG
ncbi:MAG: molybdopterin-dependent oxidoreductase, partial [Gemmatimonadaceae bacterium]